MFESLGLSEWIGIVSVLLLAVSEALPFSKKVKSNGIFQMVKSLLGLLKKK